MKGGLAAPRCPRPRADRGASLRDERGAGTALALAIVACELSLALLVTGVGSAAIAQARAAAVADAAALAAADALSGFVDGPPCELARAVAGAGGARLEACRVAALDVRVAVAIPLGPLQARADARAGPPR